MLYLKKIINQDLDRTPTFSVEAIRLFFNINLNNGETTNVNITLTQNNINYKIGFKKRETRDEYRIFLKELFDAIKPNTGDILLFKKNKELITCEFISTSNSKFIVLDTLFENSQNHSVVVNDFEEITQLIEDKDNKGNNVEFDTKSYIVSLSKANLQFNENLIKRFVGSLITKPFVILTGLAGSGKTKLAQSFIQWICESEDQYKIVPVGADWINREPLLGYPNGLKQTEYVTPDNGVLQLIIDAAKEENQEKPYFLLLDEMNLSHVERYFADFLSIMESSDSIKLYTGSERTSTNGVEIPQNIFWPKNLFIIGTVNIDETTYMFSPKVLDRANVIEFRLDDKDLSDFLSNPKKVDLSELITQGASMASSFLALAQATDTEPNENLNATLVQFFKELKIIGAEFGYRSAFEIHLLFAQLSQIDANLTVDKKIDFAVMQKLLPKLHGSRSKIVTSLEALMKLCLVDTTNFNSSKLDEIEESNIKYKVSFEKLKRMYFNALINGFTSYAEA